MSVLESLRLYQGEKFGLATAIAEATMWMEEGQSMYAKRWEEMKAFIASAAD